MTTIKYGVVDIKNGTILCTENVKTKALRLAKGVNADIGYKRCGVVKITTTTNIEIEQEF